MNKLDDLESKLEIIENIFSGHSHKEIGFYGIFKIMSEMDLAFIEAYNAGIKEKELEPLNKRYIQIVSDYLKKKYIE